MQTRKPIWLLALALLFFTACAPTSSSSTTGKRNPQQVFVHYMLVGSAKPYSGHWGFMWEMAGSCNPDRQDHTGRREICSRYYPVIGPYDERDPAVLEYHALLMRLSGVDGVMFDWYGTFPFADLGWTSEHDRATLDMVAWLERAGLRYALVFEDSPFKNLGKHTPDAVGYTRDTLLPYKDAG